MEQPNYDNIFEEISSLIANQKYNEAINKLQTILQQDSNNVKAKALLEYIQRILNYMNRNIYASTNLDLDPWEE
ncbi:hypothetical protein [Microbacter margulisiae]|uniref:Uncharacterized protein n=1 Tax=Microbacter margulisiae TaxID=1350067 RepID=A0A7W5DPP7_9PORP|nr:hypothetical protein [Microbacter margulisiae]MBB3186279.1 hypothetical protein [Microbacter margulisiae]